MNATALPSRLPHRRVASALGSYLGTAVTAVEDLPGSVANQDFMVHTASGDVIVKTGPVGELRAEAWACERLRGEGVMVPEIAGLETDGRLLPLPFLVIRRLPGAGLDGRRNGGRESRADRDVLAEAGRQLRAVHTIKGEGYGRLARAPALAAPDPLPRGITGPGPGDPPDPRYDAPVGPYPVWSGATREPLGCLDHLVAHEVIRAELADGVRDVLDRFAGVVAYDGTGVLLHGDLKPAHVFADQGRLTGIIDWGDVAFGDPRYDLARFSRHGDEPLAALLAGYGTRLDADLAVTLAVYRVIWNTLALHYEHLSGGDWFDAYRSGIVADVRALA